MQQTIPGRQYVSQPNQTRSERPLGVTILSILAAIAGGISLGFVAAVIAGIITAEPYIRYLVFTSPSNTAGAAAATVGAVLLASLVFGVACLAFAAGAWLRKGWARWLGIVICVLAALASFLAYVGDTSAMAALVAALISALVVVYLLTDAARRAFTHA